MRKLPDPLSRQTSLSKEFLEYAGQLVDDVLAEPACRRMEAPPALPATRTFGDGPPPRFRREPDIWLKPLRFGRTRLFLAHFIGRLAWRGGL